MCDALADDTRCAYEVMGRVGKVHRAAKAATDTVASSIDFRHHQARGCTEHEGITMTSISTHREIVVMPGCQSSHDCRFSAIGEMGMPANRSGVLDESPLHAVFKLADADHLSIDPD